MRGLHLSQLEGRLRPIDTFHLAWMHASLSKPILILSVVFSLVCANGSALAENANPVLANKASVHGMKAPSICYGWADISDAGTLIERRKLSQKITKEIVQLNLAGKSLQTPLQDYGEWNGVGFLVLTDCDHAPGVLRDAFLKKQFNGFSISKLYKSHEVALASDPRSLVKAGNLFSVVVHAEPKIRTTLEIFSSAVQNRYRVEDCLVSMRYTHHLSYSSNERPRGMAIGIALNRLGLPVVSYSGVGDTFFVLFYDRCEWKIDMVSDALNYAEQHENLRDIPIIEVGKYTIAPDGSSYVAR